MSEIPRIFVNSDNINLDSGIINITDKDEIHYLKNVQRIKVNDDIIILDGLDKEYISLVTNIEKDLIEVKNKNINIIPAYPKINITVVQGLLKGDKQELLLQKVTELGVNTIICLVTDYSNVKMTDSKALNNKLLRMKKVVLNASKQSKRASIPNITINKDLKEVLDQDFKDVLKIVCLENVENKTIKSILKSENKGIKNVCIFIGPEGGWSEKEKGLFEKYSIKSVSLGKNILRAETAAILATGYLIYEYEFE